MIDDEDPEQIQARSGITGHRQYKRFYVAGVAVLIVGVAALGAFLFHHPALSAPSAAAVTPALTVTRQSPHLEEWPDTIDAPGAVFAWQEASIGTQIAGYQLVDVRVNVGDRVKKGQILARFDPALLQAEEAQIKANFEQADANRQRALALQASGGISAQDVLGFVTQAKATEALLNSKRLQLRYTDVVAPDDGTISSRTATLGAVTSVGQELFRMVRQDRLEWRGELTAEQLRGVRAGQQVRLELPDGSASMGRVRTIAPLLDTTSRIAIVYVDLDRSTTARAGMYADGHIVLQTTNTLVVPAEAVVVRDGRSYVFKLDAVGTAPSKVTRVAVSTGRHNGDLVEIITGISARDEVVVKGAGFLDDGDVVRVVDDGAPPVLSSASDTSAESARSSKDLP